jgi:hypothetical protein
MLSETAPLAGVAERVAASALHIGFTLLVARQPRLALATAPAHSGVNLAALALLRRSTLLAESFVGGVGALALAAGLAAFGRLPGARPVGRCRGSPAIRSFAAAWYTSLAKNRVSTSRRIGSASSWATEPRTGRRQ